MIGIFGLTFLIYGAHQTFLAMQPAMNIIWVVPETRHWFKQRLVALAATFFTLILLPLDIAASYLTVRVADYGGHWINSAVLMPRCSKASRACFRLSVTTILFAVLYQILPGPSRSVEIGVSRRRRGGVLLADHQIRLWILPAPLQGYKILYGSLSSIVVLVVWMYYSMALLLWEPRSLPIMNSCGTGVKRRKSARVRAQT